MKELVSQIIDSYYKNLRAPKIEELNVEDQSMLQEKWCVFVTLYLWGEVHGSAGNIKEIGSNSLAQELIESTIAALTMDSRFKTPSLEEKAKLQFRVDKIMQRKVIDDDTLKSLDPIKFGVIAIKKDLEKLAVILPNMSAKLLTGEDFISALEKKLSDSPVDATNYTLYSIETESESSF